MIKLSMEELHCPDIVLNLKTKVDTLTESDTITLYTTDPLSPLDVKYLCFTRKDLEFISYEKENDKFIITIEYKYN